MDVAEKGEWTILFASIKVDGWRKIDAEISFRAGHNAQCRLSYLILILSASINTSKVDLFRVQNGPLRTDTYNYPKDVS